MADPIDGTSNFVRGIPAFCVSLAFARRGCIEVGIVYDPIVDEMFVAELGRGAWLNGERIRVSTETDMGRATVEAGWSRRLPMERYIALVGRLTDAGAGIRRAGSGALGSPMSRPVASMPIANSISTPGMSWPASSW